MLQHIVNIIVVFLFVALCFLRSFFAVGVEIVDVLCARIEFAKLLLPANRRGDDVCG